MKSPQSSSATKLRPLTSGISDISFCSLSVSVRNMVAEQPIRKLRDKSTGMLTSRPNNRLFASASLAPPPPPRVSRGDETRLKVYPDVDDERDILTAPEKRNAANETMEHPTPQRKGVEIGFSRASSLLYCSASGPRHASAEVQDATWSCTMSKKALIAAAGDAFLGAMGGGER